ncbi:MAG TPA: hypothetical protein VE907_22545 [Gammaproteobacteria bacterium]|nr:hypothetical protein [Gammaproteobacteria bacterium]
MRGRGRTGAGAALVCACFGAGAAAAAAQPHVDFVAASPAYGYAVREYREIWDEYGERIVASLEARTCLHFPEADVSAVVGDEGSHSGGPEHAMGLRASYPRSVKESTLVHELGHRHLWQLTERLDGVDGHRTLYLILDLVWADVWGKDFAGYRVQGESGWRGDYDYAAAWSWARALAPEERARLWNELLSRNGLPATCNGAVEPTAHP